MDFLFRDVPAVEQLAVWAEMPKAVTQPYSRTNLPLRVVHRSGFPLLSMQPA